MRNEQERAKTERELHSELEKNLTVAERLQLRNAARAEACNPNLWRKPQWRFPSEYVAPRCEVFVQWHSLHWCSHPHDLLCQGAQDGGLKEHHPGAV